MNFFTSHETIVPLFKLVKSKKKKKRKSYIQGCLPVFKGVNLGKTFAQGMHKIFSPPY